MESFLVSAYRLINLYNSKSRAAHLYECGVKLYPAQVHMLEAIGTNDGITLSETAAMLYVTRAAASQCIKQLCKMDLVIREEKKGIGGAQELHLTEKGLSVFSEHHIRHRDMINAIEEIWNGCSDEARNSMMEIMAITEKHIRDLEG